MIRALGFFENKIDRKSSIDNIESTYHHKADFQNIRGGARKTEWGGPWFQLATNTASQVPDLDTSRMKSISIGFVYHGNSHKYEKYACSFVAKL